MWKSNNYAALAAAILGLSGCVGSSPELAASTNAVPASERIVTGAPVRECLRDETFREGTEVSEKAFYEPGITYEFANDIRARGKEGLATRLRVYSLPIKGRNLFGQAIEPSRLCFYDAAGGRLRLIEKMSVPDGGRVPDARIQATIWRLMEADAG